MTRRGEERRGKNERRGEERKNERRGKNERREEGGGNERGGFTPCIL
jgi:hypothetical protein